VVLEWNPPEFEVRPVAGTESFTVKLHVGPIVVEPDGTFQNKIDAKYAATMLGLERLHKITRPGSMLLNTPHKDGEDINQSTKSRGAVGMMYESWVAMLLGKSIGHLRHPLGPNLTYQSTCN
jgi:hypothetical protein